MYIISLVARDLTTPPFPYSSITVRLLFIKEKNIKKMCSEKRFVGNVLKNRLLLKLYAYIIKSIKYKLSKII